MLKRIRSKLSRRGSATVAALTAVVAFVGITGAFLAMAARSASERNEAGAQQRAFLAASSGIAHTVANMNTEGVADPLGANVGYSKHVPVQFSKSSYWTSVTDNGDGTFIVRSTGAAADSESVLEVLVGGEEGGIFANAIFAGNSDEDPDYELELGGLGVQADEIDGDIYSGGDIVVVGDADVDGTARAKGTLTGISGESGKKQPIPDLDAMNYEVTADFDVAALFAGATYAYDNAGGNAYQVPESNPAHIFRKNPSDRSTENGSTVKDDYYLEDPYESVSSDSAEDGSNVYKLTLSGISGEPGVSSNKKVFFIDGNVWVHNYKTMSLGLSHSDPNGVQVTFVVKGNIYFSDSFFYDDEEKDGVAFIAMKDDDVDDSGNIYFGDPEFGTLKRMYAFMYAENDFYDINLDKTGSSIVEVYGNMTAGNRVLIDRDFGTTHTRLYVNFDERIAAGDLDMPMLPLQSGAEPTGFKVQGWWHAGAH